MQILHLTQFLTRWMYTQNHTVPTNHPPAHCVLSRRWGPPGAQNTAAAPCNAHWVVAVASYLMSAALISHQKNWEHQHQHLVQGKILLLQNMLSHSGSQMSCHIWELWLHSGLEWQQLGFVGCLSSWPSTRQHPQWEASLAFSMCLWVLHKQIHRRWLHSCFPLGTVLMVSMLLPQSRYWWSIQQSFFVGFLEGVARLSRAQGRAGGTERGGKFQNRGANRHFGPWNWGPGYVWGGGGVSMCVPSLRIQFRVS